MDTTPAGRSDMGVFRPYGLLPIAWMSRFECDSNQTIHCREWDAFGTVVPRSRELERSAIMRQKRSEGLFSSLFVVVLLAMTTLAPRPAIAHGDRDKDRDKDDSFGAPDRVADGVPDADFMLSFGCQR